MLEYLALFAIAIIALYLWFRDRGKETQRRIDDCQHPAELQQTLRVNAILAMNPTLLHAVLPGRRWLKKECRACGWQRHVYESPNLQPWDEYVADWKQETIDREAEYRAREFAHRQEVENNERIRQLKRDKGIKHANKS